MDNNMKFQVEIVQQLEFTTSSVNLQPQQISTNVTVKTTANGSMTTKYEPQEMKPKMNDPQKMQQMAPPDILQDFKQEPDNEFAELDFGSIANFMGNDENELKKLFSNISEVFDQSDLFDDTKHIKQEPMIKPQQHQMQHVPQMMPHQVPTNQFNQYVMQEPMQMQKPVMQMQQQQQQAQQMRMFQQQPQEVTPAAQTLKNMAQQHQVRFLREFN